MNLDTLARARENPVQLKISPIAQALARLFNLFTRQPKAQASEYVEGFGLTSHEFDLVRTLPDSSRCFLIKHGTDSVVARLNLSGLPDLLTVLSGPRVFGATTGRPAGAARRRPRRLDAAPSELGRLMAGACPAIDPDGPLVQALMSDADCHVQALVQSGYGVLFAAGGAFSGALTLLMTLFVALIGYAMLLGRAPLSVSGLVLSAVKLGVVLALTTQWATYQTVVYDFLFHGPEAVGSALLKGLSDAGAGPPAGVFDQLQRAYADLTGFSPNIIPPGGLSSAPALQVNPAAPLGAGLAGNTDASTLMLAATILIVSTVGVLIAAKVVLGLLLAVGPLFIALFLFDGTRGLFEGWLRAAIGFALTPLFVGVLTALGVALLSPWLDRLEAMEASGTYVRGVAFSILVLTLVLAAVTAGVIVAAAIVGVGLRLPRLRSPQADHAGVRETASTATSSRSRVQVIADATRTLESRDTVRSRSSSIASAASSRTMTRSFGVSSGVTMATAPGVTRRSAGPRPARLRKVD